MQFGSKIRMILFPLDGASSLRSTVNLRISNGEVPKPGRILTMRVGIPKKSAKYFCTYQISMSTDSNNLFPNEICCHLPFKYRGVTYHTCTKVKHDQLWCATKVDAGGNYIKGIWKNCDKNCKFYFVPDSL